MKPHYAYILTLIGYFGLLSLLMLWQTLFASPTHLSIAISLLLTVTPLLIPLRGLLQAHRKSYVWAAYLSLFYFIHGTGEAYANPDERLFAVLEIICSLLVIFGATGFVYFNKQVLKS